MKGKNLFLIFGVVLVIGVAIFLVWGGKSSTLEPSDAPLTGSPFGTAPDTVSVPAASRNFEGEVVPLDGTTSTSESGYKLYKLAGTPVAGFIALSRGATSTATTVVRYAERATGHIFDTKLPLTEGEPEKTRITNNTLPQIYEAYFRPDGNAALYRTLDEEGVVKNMSISLTAPKSTSTDGLSRVSLVLLRGTLDGISAGAGDTLVYAAKDSKAIVSSHFNGDAVKTLLNTPFLSWRTSRLGANTLLLTKSSASLPGYAYALGTGGALTKLVGPLNGLSAVANAGGTALVYSYSGASNTFVKDIQKGTVSSITPATIAEKCVWSTKDKAVFYCGAPSEGVLAGEPDGWYQGKTHFSDYIWSFDSATESSSLLVEPQNAFGIDIDVTNPTLSPDEKYLIFINKRDLSLWALKLR